MRTVISILPTARFSATNFLSLVATTRTSSPMGSGNEPRYRAPSMPDKEPTEHSDEMALLKAVGRGDRAAFSVFYDRFSSPVFALAMAILRSQSEAEDALQDVMVKIWGKAQAYNPQSGKPLSWVMTLTRNHAIDRLRSLKRHQEVRQEASDNQLFSPLEKDTRQEAERRESATAIQRAMLELPEEQRQAIELAYFHGLTHSEIASTLNQPVGTIKARIRRGMQRLRGKLTDAT